MDMHPHNPMDADHKIHEDFVVIKGPLFNLLLTFTRILSQLSLYWSSYSYLHGLNKSPFHEDFVVINHINPFYINHLHMKREHKGQNVLYAPATVTKLTTTSLRVL